MAMIQTLTRAAACCGALLAATASAGSAEMAWIRLSDDGTGFVESGSGRPFLPWGFNYDHDASGRLLEDYWVDQWQDVEADFHEMKQLGANVVRVHLQFGAMMSSPTTPRPSSVAQLARLVRLAEQTELYLDITGLGCYHKPDVPAWYDQLSQSERWQAQAVFWETVAQTCAESPAVFCYDLMNEPVVPGGARARDDWLGPALGDKHFVQFIALKTDGRERWQIAQQWIKTLVTALRRHDQRHLVTVGLVPWSLDRPGLTSGFIPEKIAGELDFLAVHIYPKRGKVDESLETLRGFAAVGKPVVIEEMFPLACDAQELGEFIDASRPLAAGWIGFYWGRTVEQYHRPDRTLADALMLSWLELFQAKSPHASGSGSAPPAE